MNKRGILISLAVLAACIAATYAYSRRYPPVQGYVQLDSGQAQAVLKMRSSIFGKLYTVTQAAPVTVGKPKLKPVSLTVSKRESGKNVQLVGKGPWGDFSKISVEDGGTTTVKLGEPFLFKPSVTKIPGQVQIDFRIFGQAGEQYQIPRLTIPPRVKIMDENGKILASGNFSYG